MQMFRFLHDPLPRLTVHEPTQSRENKSIGQGRFFPQTIDLTRDARPPESE
jgi:hypothetical protein